jgi:hypothetical protein
VRVGKRKRVQRVLRWAIDNNPVAGRMAVSRLIEVVRGCGGFQPGSSNYSGDDPIRTCIEAFATEPTELTRDELLRSRSLLGLNGRELTAALRSYVTKAQNGYHDSVLVAGTDKDLIEATAAHVLAELYGVVPTAGDFPILLGQAFGALNLAARRPKVESGGLNGATVAMSVAIYDLGCAVNRLRNKAGSGHGRPFVTNLSSAHIRAATEAAGLVAGWMLDALVESTGRT